MRAIFRTYQSYIASVMAFLILTVSPPAFADATTECSYKYGDGNFPTLGCCGGEDERLCVQDDWWNFSDAPEICKLGLVASDFFTCARPRGIGESCGPLAPCGNFIGTGGSSISLVCLPFVQQCMPSAEETDAEMFPPDACDALRSAPFQSLAAAVGMTMSYGLSQTTSAGISKTFEVGTVYAPDGKYGCYLTECDGGGIDLSISIGACAGLTSPYAAFPGTSEVISLGGSTPITQVGFSTTNSWPPGTSTSACFDLGFGPLPASGNVYECRTSVALVGSFDPVTGDPIPQRPDPRYFLTTRTGGTGTGSIERDTEACTGWPGCEYETAVTLTATPHDNGSVFAGWSGYLCEGMEETCTVKVTDNMRVTAMFENDPQYVTVVKEGTGYCAVKLQDESRSSGDHRVDCIFEASQDDGPDGPTNGQTRVFRRVGEPLGSSCTIPVFADANGVAQYSVLERSPCLVSELPNASCGGDIWDSALADPNGSFNFGFLGHYGFDWDEAKATVFTGWGGDGSTGTPSRFRSEEPVDSDYYQRVINGSFFIDPSAAVIDQSDTVVIRCEKEPDVDLRIVGRRTPEPNVFGWNNDNVVVSFDCINSAIDVMLDDPPDPLAHDPVVLSNEGEGQSVTGLCADKFGFTREETISDINIDFTPPTLVIPPDQTLPQAGPEGTPVVFAAVVSDALSGVDDGFADCIFWSAEGTKFPAISGMLFPPGPTTVECIGSDLAGNFTEASFEIMVVDETPPSLVLPLPILVDATGPLGAAVAYTVSANDGEGYSESGVLQTIEVIPSCSPESGSVFPLGANVVSCSAADRAGNTISGEFSVTVLNVEALTKDACMMGGWGWSGRASGEPFKNQGDCIQYVNTGK